MPLVDLLYRCPYCGHDAMHGQEGRAVSCTDCGRDYEHLPDGDVILVTETGGRTFEMDTLEAIERMGGPEPAARGTAVEAAVVARFVREEESVRYRGAVVGFVERRGPARSGTLRIDRDRIEFRETTGAEHRWPLLDVRAVQAASSAVQISPLEGGVVTFKMLDDSPKRWEDLLRGRLSEAWKRAGRGEIVEFQPRIRTAPKATEG